MKYFLLAGLVFAGALAGQPKPGEGSVEGQVVNALTGAPIRKATVRLETAQATTSGVWLVADTDAAGKFEFTGLPPGTYKLSASRSGFFDRPARRPLYLNPDEQVAHAEIRLPPEGAISGRVLDGDGYPVAPARVSTFKHVYRDGRRHWERRNGVQTNHTGEYHIPGLRPGRYLVRAESMRPEIDNRYGERDKPKVVHVATYYGNAPDEQGAVPVDMGVGADVRGIDIHLSTTIRPRSGARVRVRGKVTGVQPDSKLVIHVVLIRADSDERPGYALAEPPDYAFDLSAPPGQYTISANVYSGGPAAYASGSLTVTEDVSGVMLAMNPPAYVAGQIRMAESDRKVKLQGVGVALRRHDDGRVYQVRSDAAGRFAFPEPVRPGPFAMNVEASSLPESCFIQAVLLGGQEVFPAEVEIAASAHFEIVLSNTAGNVTGSVSDGDGRPFPNSIVTLIPVDGKSQPVKQSADDKGNFTITGLRPGKYKLLAWEEVDDDLWPAPDFHKKYENRATEITLGPNGTQSARLRVIATEEMN